MSKIKSLTIVCQQGTKSYIVGQAYNGLKINEIIDNSVEHPDSITIMFSGRTAENEFVFEAINAPIEVEYEK
jgi:hypothetical protein